MKVNSVLAKWSLIAVVAWLCLLLSPYQAAADQYEPFVEISCDPKADTFEIKKIGVPSDTPHASFKRPSEMKKSRIVSNGRYSLYDLLAQVGTEDEPSLVPITTLTKSCKLSSGTFVAHIAASKGVKPRGLCGGAPPSVELTMSTKGGPPFISELVFDNCYSSPFNFIQSILIRSAKKEVVVSAMRGLGRKSISKTFPMSPPPQIDVDEIVAYTLAEAHERALADFKKSNNPYNAIEMLEKAGVKGALEKRPPDFTEAADVNLLNDYGFFLSETSNRYKDAIPILKKVIELDPKRHVAHLNLGDAYQKDTYGPADPSKQELPKLIRMHYEEYARLLKEKGIATELPQRVRDVLEAAKSK